jgi:DNA-binding transcriptional regulator YiaG
MKKKYQSKILQAIHEDAADMHKLGIISDSRMHEYDRDCLVQEPKKTRKTTSLENRSAGTVRNVRVSAKAKGD